MMKENCGDRISTPNTIIQTIIHRLTWTTTTTQSNKPEYSTPTRSSSQQNHARIINHPKKHAWYTTSIKSSSLDHRNENHCIHSDDFLFAKNNPQWRPSSKSHQIFHKTNISDYILPKQNSRSRNNNNECNGSMFLLVLRTLLKKSCCRRASTSSINVLAAKKRRVSCRVKNWM